MWPGEPGVFQEFARRVTPLHDRAYAATVESRHLATLRDTLLPHLMSGRITVRDAEKAVEEVL
jgi:type I restriction enzyme S subunit